MLGKAVESSGLLEYIADGITKCKHISVVKIRLYFTL